LMASIWLDIMAADIYASSRWPMTAMASDCDSLL
jgi:hypothetical protein